MNLTLVVVVINCQSLNCFRPFTKDNNRFSTLDVLLLVSRLPPVFPQQLALLTDFCCISDKRIQVGFLTSSGDFIWISVKRIFVSKGWTKGVHLPHDIKLLSFYN